MASDRLAGILMCAGAATALVGTGLIGLFFFSLLTIASFGLVFLFGLYVARKRPEGRILAVATLWFATVGGLPFLWIVGLSTLFGSLAVSVGYVGLLGTTIVIAGATLKLAEWQDGPASQPPSALFERRVALGSGKFLISPGCGGILSRFAVSNVWRVTMVDRPGGRWSLAPSIRLGHPLCRHK